MSSRTREGPPLEELVRFCHPRKILAGTRLPVPEALDRATVAALAGTTAARYAGVSERIRAEAHATASELAGHAALSSVRLPDGSRLLAVGDSITDDLGSWREMLAAAVALARPDSGVRVLDGGLSGDTTTGVVSRSARLPVADVAIVLLGTNDARRHGRDGMPVLVSDRETERNVRLLDRLLRRRCGRVIWVMPPPVVEERIEADPGLREADLLWRLDDVRRKAAIIRHAVPGAIDLWPAFGDPPAPELLRPDGLHPSLAGQRLIAAAVLDGL